MFPVLQVGGAEVPDRSAIRDLVWTGFLSRPNGLRNIGLHTGDGDHMVEVAQRAFAAAYLGDFHPPVLESDATGKDRTIRQVDTHLFALELFSQTGKGVF